MNSEKESSFVIFINGKIDNSTKDQIITHLQDEGLLLVEVFETKRDLNQWIRSSSDNSLLFLTDAKLDSQEVKQVLEKLDHSIICCIHEEEVKVTHSENGNEIKAFLSFEELADYCYQKSEQVTDFMLGSEVEAHIQEEFINHLQNPTIQYEDGETEQLVDTKEEQERGLLYSEGANDEELGASQDEPESDFPMGGYDTSDPYEDIHPALKKIKEYQDSIGTTSAKSTMAAIVNDTQLTQIEESVPDREKIEEQPSEEGYPEKEDKTVNYTESPNHNCSCSLQKQLFFQNRWEGNRVIGIWSPLHRAGVTSLTMNFAFYLAQRRIFTVVLEGLTGEHGMKDWLKRYTTVPANWTSYAKALQSDEDKGIVQWVYKNVNFLPLEKGDSQFDWTAKTLELYMTTPNIVDVTLVDMPTGEMEVHTKDSLHYLDELWIVVDDAIQETIAWKSYIQELKETLGIPIQLVFNKTYEFSQDKRLSKEMDLPLLTSIPSLHEETMQNYYENKPLFFQEGIKEKLEPAYVQMTNHLFGENVALDRDSEKPPKLMKRALLPILSLFKPLIKG